MLFLILGPVSGTKKEYRSCTCTLFYFPLRCVGTMKIPAKRLKNAGFCDTLTANNVEYCRGDDMNAKTPTDERQEGRDTDDILQAPPEKPSASVGRKRYCVLDGIKALETVGRYSLQIYMLHQPVLYGCFMLLTAACRNMIC